MIKRLLAVFIIISTQSIQSGYTEENIKEPEEYQEDEFPQYLKDLRRGEIIFFGSIPFSFFFAFETYGIYRWISHDTQAEYRPWPFESPARVPYSPDETLLVIVSALSISFLIALADFIIGKIDEQGSTEHPVPDS